MKAVSGREFARLVERRGWHCCGSPAVIWILRLSMIFSENRFPLFGIMLYGKAGSVVRLSIPIHGNRPLKIGLLRHLAKLAEISDADLQ